MQHKLQERFVRFTELTPEPHTNHGYIIWIQAQWSEFYRTHKEYRRGSAGAHIAFDRWLAAQAEAIA